MTDIARTGACGYAGLSSTNDCRAERRPAELRRPLPEFAPLAADDRRRRRSRGDSPLLSGRIPGLCSQFSDPSPVWDSVELRVGRPEGPSSLSIRSDGSQTNLRGGTVASTRAAVRTGRARVALCGAQGYRGETRGRFLWSARRTSQKTAAQAERSACGARPPRRPRGGHRCPWSTCRQHMTERNWRDDHSSHLLGHVTEGRKQIRRERSTFQAFHRRPETFCGIESCHPRSCGSEMRQRRRRALYSAAGEDHELAEWFAKEWGRSSRRDTLGRTIWWP